MHLGNNLHKMQYAKQKANRRQDAIKDHEQLFYIAFVKSLQVGKVNILPVFKLIHK